MSQDAELLRQYAESRSEGAFAELVRRHLNLVYFAALRRTGGNAPLAEDIAQDVFTALARQAATLTRHATLAGWLYTTTRFTAAKTLRREQRRKVREQEAHFMSEPSTEFRVAADWERIHPLLDAVLDELNDRDREAVLLRCLEGRPFAEIGATLSVTEDAARMRVERALDKLHALLAKRGVTSTAAALGLVLSVQAAVPVPGAVAASVTSAAFAGVSIAASGSMATWMTFISMTKVQTGVAAAALLAAGAAFYGSKFSDETRARHHAARQALSAASVRLVALERDTQAAALRRAELERELEEARLARTTSATTAPALASKHDSQLEIIRQQARVRQALERTHPEYQRLAREAGRRDLRRQYGPLYHELRFTPERVGAFERIMVDHDWMRTDVESAAKSEGMGDADPGIRKLLADVEQQRDTALYELLGPEQHRLYEQFRYSEGVRCEITNWMAGALYQTESPLNGAQAKALTEILVRHTAADEENRADAQAIQWAAVLTEARNVLAPAQMPFLESMRVQMEWRNVFNRAVGRLDEEPATQKRSGG